MTFALRRGVMKTIRTILVPVDFSAGSAAALEHARDLAEMFDSDIHVFHVTAASEVPAWAQELFGTQLRPLEAQHRLHTLDRLALMIVAHRLNPRRTKAQLRVGCAEETIARYADEIRADLVVMGVHGDCHMPQAPVGQVVERVLGQVHCPVLTVREEQMKSVVVAVAPELGELVAC